MPKYALYVEKESIIHKIDPRAKLSWVLCVFIWSMTFNDPLWTLMIFIIVFSIGLISKTLKEFKFAYPGMISLFIMCLILWPLFRRIGNIIIFEFGPLIFYKEAFLYALAVGIRLCAMILAGLIFLATTKVEDLEVGLVKIGLPYSIAFGISGVFRFIPTLLGDGQLILSAQEARGLDLRSGSIFSKLRKAVPIIAPLLVTTFRRTGELAMAMESRGFSIRGKRTSIIQIKFIKKDYLFTIFSIILTIIFIVLRIIGYGAIIPQVL